MPPLTDNIKMALRFLCALVLTSAAFAADFTQVRTVYLLSMGNGLDQYLANRLTERGRFQVVTDPAAADAILTDRIGPVLEARLKELYPPPEPETKEVKEEDEKDKSAGLPEFKGDKPIRTPFVSRSKGNVFLVDRRTHRVLWSHYERPRNTQPDELDRVAEIIAARITKAAK